MCLAANFSGKAISISKTTAPHAVSYPFTSYFGISHGHAVALNLGKFLKFNYSNLEKSKTSFNLNERYKLIFDATKTNSINELITLIDRPILTVFLFRYISLLLILKLLNRKHQSVLFLT